MHEDHVVSWVTDPADNTEGTHNSRPVYCSEYTGALEKALESADKQTYAELRSTYGFLLPDQTEAQENPDWS